jgi:hypothetical protein
LWQETGVKYILLLININIIITAKKTLKRKTFHFL